MSLADKDITQLDLADVLGLSDRQLRNLKRAIPPSGKRGTSLVYKLGPAVQAYIAHTQGATQEKYSQRDLAEARIRREIAQAKKEECLARSAEVAARRDEDQVVEIVAVQEELESIFANVRARARAIPSKIIAALIGLIGQEKATQVQREVEEHIDEALAELASPILDGRQPVEPSDEA